MADTPDTPDAPTSDAPAPTPRRRAAPRKATASTAPKPNSRKSVSAQVEDGGVKAATAVKSAADTAVKTVKPRSASRAAGRTGARTAAAPRTAGAKRATGATKRSTTRKTGGGQSTFDRATAKVGGKWGAASILGGIAAAGATLVALLTLRGSAVKTPPKAAHQPDGTDSSKSFHGGIADENTVPNQV